MAVLQQFPAVHLELGSEPESVGLVRAALQGVAESVALEEELLADVITAVSEACNNVVLHAYESHGPMFVDLAAADDCVEVVVRDQGAGIRRVAHAEDRLGLGLALISALADRVEFLSPAGVGTEVRALFGRQIRFPRRLGVECGAWERRGEISGQVMGELCPVEMLGSVLGRIARLLAARNQFSLERVHDLYLVVDALAAHARSHASAGAVGFSLSAGARWLQLTVGPLESHGKADEGVHARELGPPLSKLIDELGVQAIGESDILSVIVRDEFTRSDVSAA